MLPFKMTIGHKLQTMNVVIMLFYFVLILLANHPCFRKFVHRDNFLRTLFTLLCCVTHLVL